MKASPFVGVEKKLTEATFANLAIKPQSPEGWPMGFVIIHTTPNQLWVVWFDADGFYKYDATDPALLPERFALLRHLLSIVP